MLFDFVIFAFAMRKAYLHYQRLPKSAWTTSSLMAVLIRDSVLYFLWSVYPKHRRSFHPSKKIPFFFFF